MASKRFRCRTNTLGKEQNDICFVLYTDAAEHESHAMRAVRFSIAENLAKQSLMLRASATPPPLLRPAAAALRPAFEDPRPSALTAAGC